MADVNQLRKEVKWWTDELHARQRKAEEALRELARFQRSLAQAEQDEARRASSTKKTT